MVGSVNWNSADSYTERTTCRLCGSTDLALALDLGRTPLANELDGTELFPLAVNRCKECEHHQLSIVVKAERLWGPSYPYRSGTSPVFRAHLEKLAQEIAWMRPGSSVLEIGSNDGTLLDMLNARGLKALGIDPSAPERPDTLRESWPPTRMADVVGSDKPNVIVALNVFAHVDDLGAFTDAVREALAPDGVFIVEVGYLPTMVERGVFDTIYHEHLSYHSIGPLQDFFERRGMRITQAELNESQGGSVRLHVVNGEPEWPEWTFHENVRIERLNSSIARSRRRLRREMRGYRFAGFGCPAKFATLGHALHIGEVLELAAMFDDNPAKVGRRAPGTNITIQHTGDLVSWTAANPSVPLVLFSWNFASEIIPRLRNLGYTGEIINPMGDQF